MDEGPLVGGEVGGVVVGWLVGPDVGGWLVGPFVVLHRHEGEHVAGTLNQVLQKCLRSVRCRIGGWSVGRRV